MMKKNKRIKSIIKQQEKETKELFSIHYNNLTKPQKEQIRRKLYLEQEYNCAICGKKEKNRKLSLDHNHTTGHIRGLLCQSCNFILGAAKDNPYILRIAAEYLTKKRIFI